MKPIYFKLDYAEIHIMCYHKCVEFNDEEPSRYVYGLIQFDESIYQWTTYLHDPAELRQSALQIRSAMFDALRQDSASLTSDKEYGQLITKLEQILATI